MKRKWLVQLRKSQNLTQEMVARKAHIDRSFYAQLEIGTRDPSLAVAKSLANVLGVQPRLFFLSRLHDMPYERKLGPSVHTHSDVNLRYTWAYGDCSGLDGVIGKRDEDLSDDRAYAELAQLKRRVLNGEPAVEATLSLTPGGRFHVRCEPLHASSGEHSEVLSEGRPVGVYCMFTKTPEDTLPTACLENVQQGDVIYLYDDIESCITVFLEFVSDSLNRNARTLVVNGTQMQSHVGREHLPLFDDPSEDVQQAVQWLDLSTTTEAEVIQTVRNMFHASAGDRGGEDAIRIWVDCSRPPTSPQHHGEAIHTAIRTAIGGDGRTAEARTVIVCAYSSEIPSRKLTALLRYHKYFMTDGEFVYSPLYADPDGPALLPPSMSIGSEVD